MVPKCGDVMSVSHPPKEEHVRPVTMEEVQRIPTWFVKLVTAAIALATPWAVFVTYTTLANQFTSQAVQSEVTGIKGDLAALEKAYGTSVEQVVELRSEVRFLTNTTSKYEADADARADLRAAVKRLEDETARLSDSIKRLEAK